MVLRIRTHPLDNKAKSFLRELIVLPFTMSFEPTYLFVSEKWFSQNASSALPTVLISTAKVKKSEFVFNLIH